MARGVPALTLTSAGERPPDAFTDRPALLDGAHLAGIGRSAQQLLGSLDQGLELTQGTTSFVWAGARVVRGWAIELLLVGAPDPVLRRCRRPVRTLPAAAHPARPGRRCSAQQARLLAVRRPGLLRLQGARRLAHGAGPPTQSGVASGRGLAGARADHLRGAARGGVDRRPAAARAAARGRAGRAARRRDGRAARTRARRVASSGNKPVRARLRAACTARVALAAAGAKRPGTGTRDRLRRRTGRPGDPARLARVPVRARPRRAVVRCSSSQPSATSACRRSTTVLAAGACAAQLAAAAAGRYAPYPSPRERPARGPLRGLVRAIVLTLRERRVTG